MIISFLLSLIAILIYFPTNIVKIIFLIIFVGLIHLYSSYVFQRPILYRAPLKTCCQCSPKHQTLNPKPFTVRPRRRALSARAPAVADILMSEGDTHVKRERVERKDAENGEGRQGGRERGGWDRGLGGRAEREERGRGEVETTDRDNRYNGKK